MIGLFINTLPMRVEVKSEEGVSDYLVRLQAQQVEARQYEYSPLVEVQRWSEVPKGTPLFENLLVFENYPIGETLEEQRVGLEVREGNHGWHSHVLELVAVGTAVSAVGEAEHESHTAARAVLSMRDA